MPTTKIFSNVLTDGSYWVFVLFLSVLWAGLTMDKKAKIEQLSLQDWTLLSSPFVSTHWLFTIIVEDPRGKKNGLIMLPIQSFL